MANFHLLHIWAFLLSLVIPGLSNGLPFHDRRNICLFVSTINFSLNNTSFSTALSWTAFATCCTAVTLKFSWRNSTFSWMLSSLSSKFLISDPANFHFCFCPPPCVPGCHLFYKHVSCVSHALISLTKIFSSYSGLGWGDVLIPNLEALAYYI